RTAASNRAAIQLKRIITTSEGRGDLREGAEFIRRDSGVPRIPEYLGNKKVKNCFSLIIKRLLLYRRCGPDPCESPCELPKCLPFPATRSRPLSNWPGRGACGGRPRCCSSQNRGSATAWWGSKSA